MIVVLEGPDLAGKSTLAHRIMSSTLNAERLRQGPPSPSVDILEQYLRPIQDWCYEPMLVRPSLLVMDRWHVGELIYGPILRGRSRLTGQQADYIDMVLQTFGASFMYITAEPKVLQERWELRGDDLIERRQLAEIHIEYEKWMWHRPHWVAHIAGGGAHFTVGEPSPNAGWYVGPRKPRVLLLGDRRNEDTFVFPFVPARATSGHWLMGALHEAGVNHMEVGLFNACEATPLELGTQWEMLGKPPVVTLGRNAEKAWRAVGDWTENDHYLNHPQYERRFHYLQMQQYGEAIKKAMRDG